MAATQIHIAARVLDTLNANADLLARHGLPVATLLGAMDRRIEREHYNPVTVAVIAVAPRIGRVGARLNREIGNTATRRGNTIHVTVTDRVNADADALESLETELYLLAMGA